MQVFLLALVLLAAGIAGMAVTVLVKKDGKFPDGEISRNKALREQGILCAKEEELRQWKKGRRPDDCSENGCDGCTAHHSEVGKPGEVANDICTS